MMLMYTDFQEVLLAISPPQFTRTFAMIIDFRVRPPFKGFEKLSLFGKTKAFQELPFATPNTMSIPSALEFSMPLFLQEMEEAGIEKGVVLPRCSTTTPWGAVTNDEVIEGVRQYSDKFIAFGSVDPGAGIREAVQEVDRCIKTLGCRGIVIEPGFCATPLRPDSAQMYPVYDRCAELGVPIVLTLSGLAGPDISYARPDAVHRAAKDFPGLNFVIAHASYPYIYEAATLCAFLKNVWLLPDLYMHVETFVGRELYAKVLSMTQGKRVIFGSAYPYRDMRQSVRDVQSYELPKAFYEALMHRNAEELLNL